MQYEKPFDQSIILDQLQNIKISPCRKSHHLFDKSLYDTTFNSVEKFHKPGLAPVYDNSGGYHIDIHGNPAYAKRFQKVFGFYDNMAAVQDNDEYYHIDASGNRTYKQSYQWVGNYQEGICIARKNDRFFHIDLNGNKVYSEEYDYVGDFKDDVAVIYKNGLASHINKSGKLIHNRWYRKLGVFHKGYANAEDENGWFHIDLKGNPIYEARYKMVEPFYNELAKIETFEGTLGQINITGEIKFTIYSPKIETKIHKISSEFVGFWNTYLMNTAIELGILNILPATTKALSQKLDITQENIQRLLRALWEINLITYDQQTHLWQSSSKGELLQNTPFLSKASKMWARVAAENNWLKITDLLKQENIKSFPSFKEKELSEHTKIELYQALLGYTELDTKKFSSCVHIEHSENALLLGVHSLALISALRKQNINSISYYNAPKIPDKLIENFDIEVVESERLLKDHDLAILARFIHHYDDKTALSYLHLLKKHQISRILLIETILVDDSPMGGAVDINIMIETGGKLRTIKNWEYLLQSTGFKIFDILPLTEYLSVIDVRSQ